jgi:hypothetical protein
MGVLSRCIYFMLSLVKAKRLTFPAYEADVSSGGHDAFDPVRGTDPAQLIRALPGD